MTPRPTDKLDRLLVEELSARHGEPDWMRQVRLQAWEKYQSLPHPTWGPDVSSLDMDKIVPYIQPESQMATSWEQVPPDVRQSFAELGIPQAEEQLLAGVAAQYDSEVVYHRTQEMAAEQGVVFTDLTAALHGEDEPMIRQYFAKLVTPGEHKWAALHTAVWSGGTFVYVPPGVQTALPLQAYYLLNARGAGQFEHTLIIVDEGASLHFIEGCSAPRYNVAALHAGAVEIFVGKSAKIRYSTVENWSRNMYNLNTKKAQAAAGASVEWVSGSFGSMVTELYPATILAGAGAKMSYHGVTLAGSGQNLDTGVKVVARAPQTACTITAQSLADGDGVSTFRASIAMTPEATGSRASIDCQSWQLADQSRSDSIPVLDIRAPQVDVGYEACVGTLDEGIIAYLGSRGLEREQARLALVNGVVDGFAKQLPLEYAVEMANLVTSQMKKANAKN